ncbi:sensor histidine kinase [Gemmatimonas sp.]|jgi:two-component system cell cycle sensor histidine kinase/response regulator CckA|uniref:sensor histidine kinase n=1 Tax=Gemmatimonas sp. TaxID=1962908 RepID=UPI0037C008AF
MTDQLYDGRLLQSPALLTSSVAHDFNNLIAVIESYAGELEFVTEPSERLEMLAGIREAAARARALSGELLIHGRRSRTADALAPMSPPAVPTELDRCVERTMVLAQRLLRQNVQVELRLAARGAIVTCGAHYLDQLLLNLVINARDAMPDGGTLTVRTTQPQFDTVQGRAAWAELRVSDTGTGMSEATRRRIFEPFFTTKPPGKGTGLGLAIVHDRVLEAGGSIDVHSEPGQGSTFRVWLPVALPMVLPLAVPASSSPSDHAPPPANGTDPAITTAWQ